MPLNSCPHYPPAGATGPTFRCQGCASMVGNPANAQAVAEGRVHPSGAPKVHKGPGG